MAILINDLDISTEMDQAALEAVMGGHRRHHGKHHRRHHGGHHGHGGHRGHGGHHRHGRHHRRTSISLLAS